MIFLLKKFVGQYGVGKSLAHENRGRGAPFKVKIRVKKINSTYSQNRLHSQQQNNQKVLEQNVYDVHTNMTINSLINFIARKHDHDANNVRLISAMNSSNNAKNLSDKRKTLSQVGVSEGDEISAILTSSINYGMNISDDVDQSTFSPGDLMSISSKYFETLFEVLSKTSSSQLRNATWKFLMELPTSEDILQNIEAKTMDIKSM